MDLVNHCRVQADVYAYLSSGYKAADHDAGNH